MHALTLPMNQQKINFHFAYIWYRMDDYILHRSITFNEAYERFECEDPNYQKISLKN